MYLRYPESNQGLRLVTGVLPLNYSASDLAQELISGTGFG